MKRLCYDIIIFHINLISAIKSWITTFGSQRNRCICLTKEPSSNDLTTTNKCIPCLGDYICGEGDYIAVYKRGKITIRITPFLVYVNSALNKNAMFIIIESVQWYEDFRRFHYRTYITFLCCSDVKHLSLTHSLVSNTWIWHFPETCPPSFNFGATCTMPRQRQSYEAIDLKLYMNHIYQAFTTLMSFRHSLW